MVGTLKAVPPYTDRGRSIPDILAKEKEVEAIASLPFYHVWPCAWSSQSKPTVTQRRDGRQRLWFR